jgi:chemotaxis protein MotA
MAVDIATIGGILFGFAALITGFVLEGGHVTGLLGLSAAIIVIGGTIGATVGSFSMEQLRTVPAALKTAVSKKLPDELETIEMIVQLAERARREGLLYLENQLDQVPHLFLRKGLQLVIDGTEPELVRNIMETEIYSVQERHQTSISIFEAAGGYAPTMGIIGTVMGLIHVLGSLTEPERLGPAIALAFIATLYGVSTANLLWLPIATKLKNLSKKEIRLMELMLEGILSLQAGNNPILIRERLTAFLKPRKRAVREAEAEAEESYEKAAS